MGKMTSLLLSVLMGLMACGQSNSPDLCTVQRYCTSPEVYRIDYVASLDGEYLCTGGVANFDKKPLNSDPYVLVYFSKDDLEGKEEGEMSLELRLYDEKEDREIAVLGPVDMEARLGEKRFVVVDWDQEAGFSAELRA